MAIERILDIARMAAPRIRIPRGPKVTAASAAHELFLEKRGIRGASAYSYSDLEEDFIDEATRSDASGISRRTVWSSTGFPPIESAPSTSGSADPSPRREGRLTKIALGRPTWRNMAISVLEFVGRLGVSQP